MRPTVFLPAVLVILAGCALDKKPELALACQFKACTCLPAQSASLLKSKSEPVQWKTNGDAYCKKDYVLRLVEK